MSELSENYNLLMESIMLIGSPFIPLSKYPKSCSESHARQQFLQPEMKRECVLCVDVWKAEQFQNFRQRSA